MAWQVFGKASDEVVVGGNGPGGFPVEGHGEPDHRSAGCQCCLGNRGQTAFLEGVPVALVHHHHDPMVSG